MMFIIPCKFDSDHPYIFECVEAISKYHPNDKIAVVDSSSEDKSYFIDFKSPNLVWWDIDNLNYGTNAFGEVYKAHPEESYYYCIYDSLILQDNLSYLEQYPVTAFRYFNTPPTGFGFDEDGISLADWIIKKLTFSKIDLNAIESFHGVMGPMFVASNKVMRGLNYLDIFDIKPNNKYELCAMERIYGMALEHLGYDFWTNSPQGEMIDFFGDYPEDKVRKINAARM